MANRVRVQNKAGDTRVVQEGMTPPGYKVIGPYDGTAKKTDERPLNEQPKSKLQDTRNEVLKKYLDEQGIAYDADVKKEDLIKAIKGE